MVTHRKWFEAPLILLVLVVTAIRSYVGDDLWFWDEATYLKRGVYPDVFGAPTWVESPGQSAMYGLWSRIFENPIDVYFLGNATSAVIFVLGVWFAARILGTPATAFLASMVAATLPVTYIWPHLSGVPAGVLIAAMAVLLRYPGTLGRVTFVIAVWFAATFRPEFTWAATSISVVLSLVSVRNSIKAIRGPGSNSSALSPLLVAATGVLLPIFAVLRFGNIWQRSDREWTAFTQHYSLRNPQGSADVWLNATDAAAKDFPGAQSVTEAFIDQPILLLKHIAANLLQTPVSIAGHFFGVERATLAGISLGTLAALFLMGITLLTILVNRSGFVSQLRQCRINAINLISILIVFTFALTPMLIIYPRPHYQLIFVGALIVIASLILSKQLISMSPAWSRTTFTVGLVLLLSLISLQISDANSRSARFENAMRAVSSQVANAVVVTGDKEVDAFLPGSIVVEPNPTTESLATLFAELGVNVVVITPILDQTSWSIFPDYSEFINNPGSFGFREITPGSNVWVR